MYICISLSFTLQERYYTDSVSLCTGVVINLFDKKINDFVNFGTQIIECEWTLKSKFVGIHSKRIFVLDISKNSV